MMIKKLAALSLFSLLVFSSCSALNSDISHPDYHRLIRAQLQQSPAGISPIAIGGPG